MTASGRQGQGQNPTAALSTRAQLKPWCSAGTAALGNGLTNPKWAGSPGVWDRHWMWSTGLRPPCSGRLPLTRAQGLGGFPNRNLCRPPPSVNTCHCQGHALQICLVSRGNVTARLGSESTCPSTCRPGAGAPIPSVPHICSVHEGQPGHSSPPPSQGPRVTGLTRV